MRVKMKIWKIVMMIQSGCLVIETRTGDSQKLWHHITKNLVCFFLLFISLLTFYYAYVAVLVNNIFFPSFSDDESSDEAYQCPQPGLGRRNSPATRWHDVQGNSSEKPPPIWEYTPVETQPLQSSVDYFRIFFYKNLLGLIADQSNLYSIQRDANKPLNTNPNEIEQFIGLCIYMSIYGLPRSRLYWAAKTNVEKIQSVMPRNRWEQLKNSLHFNDNSNIPPREDPNRDKLFKIRPLVDSLKRTFNDIPLDDQHVCVDEQIIPFKGKSSLKQYTPNKPHKWGYKLFALCDSHGILHDFEIYSGKISPVPNLPDLGASSNVVLSLTQIIPDNQNYLVYFDNWFASPALFGVLANKGIGALGTVRLNRFRGLSFTPDKEMKKRGRGSFEEKETTIDGIDLRAVKWLDNRAVTLVSTFDSAEPADMVTRYDAKIRGEIQVPRPRIVKTYNQFMGGVDLLDSLIAYYRIRVRSKKYYLRFFFHFVDLVVVTSWLLYRRDCDAYGLDKKLVPDLLEFKADVAESLCKEGKDLKKRGRPSSSSSNEVDKTFQAKKKRGPAAAIPNFETRRDSIGHWPSFSEKRQRCKYPACKNLSSVVCTKCSVNLCLSQERNCFVEFHM